MIDISTRFQSFTLTTLVIYDSKIEADEVLPCKMMSDLEIQSR